MPSPRRLILPLLALSLSALFPCLTSTVRAQQVLLDDQFNGTSIDSSRWVASAPFATSSITESGGSAVFHERGQLVTQNEVPASLVITGRFTITGSPVDEFKIVLRTDGTFGGEYNESNNGLCVRFRGPAASGPGNDEVTVFDLTQSTSVGWTGTLNPGTTYDFKITDDGYTVAVYLTDMSTPRVVLNSTNVYGHRIALYNREIQGFNEVTQLDFLTITSEQGVGSIAGPVTNPSNGHTYYLLDSAAWTDAEAQAVALGGHLATVRSAAENQWIVNQFAGGSTANRRLWIGLHRVANDAVFGWTSNEADTFTSWCSGEPNSATNTDGFTFIVQPVADPNFPLLVPGSWNDTFDTDTGTDGREPYGVVEVNPASHYAFSYGYRTTNDANADQYVVATAGSQKYTESFGSPPTAYWGPTNNDVNATMTMRFDFASPTTEVRLHAELAAFDFVNSNEGVGTGSCSLYGSTDGTNWTLLLDNPTPSSVASYKTYDQDVPASLVGAKSFYVQVRFYADGSPVPYYTVSQFSRADANRTTDVFHLDANVASANPMFFDGQTPLSNGVYYLAFANGNYFGFYSYLSDPHYIYHFDLGYEYVFDAADGKGGVYLYDFASRTFFYTSPAFPFPYLYDFTLNTVLYYYPDPNSFGHYNTDGYRFFYRFDTGQIIVK